MLDAIAINQRGQSLCKTEFSIGPTSCRVVARLDLIERGMSCLPLFATTFWNFQVEELTWQYHALRNLAR